jgi:mono/diheme cytochrome c family protein
MANFLKVTIFGIVVIGLFAAYSNYGIPRIVPAPTPQEEGLDLAEMTMGQFIALGGRIVEGKGTCTLCHNALGRAPLLDKAAEIATQRLADDRYNGKSGDAESYLLESMVDPSAYVVAGFGKAGTGDTVSPMPDVSGGGIRLSEAEMAAVIAWLQDTAGIEVTVAIPTGAPAEAAAAAPAGEGGEPRAMLTTTEDIVAEFTCGACHKLAGEEGEVGPDLTTIGAVRDAAFIRRAILDPNAEIAEGYEADMMPPDYGEQLYAAELELLVEYLAGLK